LQGLAIRLAKAINRVLDLRGRIWGDRYHARALDAAGGSECAGVRAAELEEASLARARDRLAIVWSLVRRLGELGSPGDGQCAGRRAANVAGGGRVAALGANPSRGRAFFHPSGPTLAPETLTRRSGSPAT
ncbi:MAG TPA: hypothetical protein VLI07_11035, partial [Candidatus Binatus sp.]|nr:hypothetical protein [Candidatus Binatus sp.]